MINYWSVDRPLAGAPLDWDLWIYKCERKCNDDGGGKRAELLITDYIQLSLIHQPPSCLLACQNFPIHLQMRSIGKNKQ